MEETWSAEEDEAVGTQEILHVRRCEHGVGPGAGGAVRTEVSLQRQVRPDPGHEGAEEIHSCQVPQGGR